MLFRSDKGLYVEFAPLSDSRTRKIVHAPTAPGHHEPVGIVHHRKISLGEKIVSTGEMILAFDGERKVRVPEGVEAEFQIRRDGPQVIDPKAVMKSGRGSFLKKV